MKTAIYIEDGTTQVVLTPESEVEHNALGLLRQSNVEMKIMEGSFYDCRGGWVQQKEVHLQMHGMDTRGKESIILVARKREPMEMPGEAREA
jgi:hypothetical protein